MLAVDLDAEACRVAVSDLGATPLGERTLDFDAAQPPEAVLETVHAALGALLDEIGVSPTRIWGIGVGIQAPVVVGSGEPVAPRAMPGWDGFSIPDWFARHYTAPVLVDNHVNVMALGELWTHWRDVDHLLYVMIGPCIGCGIVSERRVHHGAQGSAGDIGHVRVAGHGDVVCHCGNTGCLEAVAGGRALAARLAAGGLAARASRDVITLARAGEPLALQAVRDAGRAVGEVLAECINFYNPSVIVIGGRARRIVATASRGRARGRDRPLAPDGHPRPAGGRQPTWRARRR